MKNAIGPLGRLTRCKQNKRVRSGEPKPQLPYISGRPRTSTVVCDAIMKDNRLKLNCKAILFDMDGTLVDSTAVVERAWAWWAKRHHLPLDEILRFSHGRPTLSTFERFTPGADHALELEEMLAYEET